MIIVKRWVIYSGVAGVFLATFYFLTSPSEPYSSFKPPEYEPLERPSEPRPYIPPPPALPTAFPKVESEVVHPSESPRYSHSYDLAGAANTASSTKPTSSSHAGFQWRDLPVQYPVATMIPIPTGASKHIPRIQYVFEAHSESDSAQETRHERLAKVKEQFLHTWKGYKKYAWLKDEVSPITGGYHNTFGGWAATLVDTLDTLWIMDLKEEFEEAVEAVGDIDFSTTEENTLNVFETTIRYLGGFLAAYDISGGKYPVLLEKAVEVGEMLYVAFDTPNRMPVTRWDWRAAKAGKKQEAGGNMLVAELGSLSVEFTRLSQLTEDPKYFDAIQRITIHFLAQQNSTKLPGMWPVLVDGNGPSFTGDNGFTLGGMSDSVYEYIPKEYLLLGGHSQDYQTLYTTAMEPIKKHIFYRPMTINNSDILLSGNARANDDSIDLDPQGQHLACFTGGMVAIGAKIFNRTDELEIAKKLVNGCIWAYESMPTGIMPETFHVVPCSHTSNCTWDRQKWIDGMFLRNTQDAESDDNSMPFDDQVAKKIKALRVQPGFTAIADRRYILRPEAIESIFVLYRITGDTTLQDKAWKMFEAVTKLAWTDIAFAALDDVTLLDPPRSDRMESFWTAETLKYYYLLYSDPDLVSLDEYVLNTEAHPLKRPVS